MSIYSVYEGLKQELADNPHWVVRVESAEYPEGSVPYHPSCWYDMPTPQSELGYDSIGLYPSKMSAFVDEHGGFNCAANHDTFERWWPLDEVMRVSYRGYGLQITIIDLEASPHLKLPMQTLIKRDNCVVVRSIPLTLH